MTISWDDIGTSLVPGTYFVHGRNIIVRADHIAVWTDHPTALFSTTWFKRGQMIGAQALTDWSVEPTEPLTA